MIYKNTFPQFHLSLTHMLFLTPRWGVGGYFPFLETGLASGHSLTEKKKKKKQPKWHYVISRPTPLRDSAGFLVPFWDPDAVWRSTGYVAEWWETMKKQKESISPLLFHPPHLRFPGLWMRRSWLLHIQLEDHREQRPAKPWPNGRTVNSEVVVVTLTHWVVRWFVLQAW